MEEPSKKWPDSNFSGPNALTGTLTCCSLPRVSVKRRSTNLTSLSLIIWNMSFGVIIFSLPFQHPSYFYISPCQKFTEDGQYSAISKDSLRLQQMRPKIALA